MNILSVRNLNSYYGSAQALFEISLDLSKRNSFISGGKWGWKVYFIENNIWINIKSEWRYCSRW